MKHKHIAVTALAALLVVMCVSTTVFASAAPEDKKEPCEGQNAPVTAYTESEKDASVMMMSNGDTGEKLYSVDGGATWMSEERYQAGYGGWGDDWEVEWWTYEDYKAWLEQEKKDLREIIGSQGWTPSTGWFTWDQAKVDETIAMYEGILEDIKNGALYSRTITDKNGNEVEDVALGSDGVMIATVCETMGDSVAAAPKAVDKAALLEELKAFGIGGNENLMTYNGQLVRTFVDGAPVGEDGYSVQYVYTNPDGAVDLHTLRAVIRNPDGSYDTMGDLIGVAAKGDKNFDQELIDCAAHDGRSQAASASGSAGGGKTFEEIFAQYADYGLSYRQGEGMGTMTWNGQPVKSFADLKPDGGAFSWQDTGAETGLYVYTEYDQNGNLVGLRTA